MAYIWVFHIKIKSGLHSGRVLKKNSGLADTVFCKKCGFETVMFKNSTVPIPRASCVRAKTRKVCRLETSFFQLFLTKRRLTEVRIYKGY